MGFLYVLNIIIFAFLLAVPLWSKSVSKDVKNNN